MKSTMLVTAAVAAALLGGSAVNAAVTISFANGSSTLTAGTVVIEDFDGASGTIYTPGTPGSAIGTNAFVYDASVSGDAARPAYGSTGNYGVVLGRPEEGSYQIDFTATSLFAFTVGSLDTYNHLTLLFDDGSDWTYDGGQIIDAAIFPSGDQVSGLTNGQVSFKVTGGPLIKGAIFKSTDNSFEFDNIAVAVPEPASWAMMIGGFALMGSTMRRRRVVAAFA